MFQRVLYSIFLGFLVCMFVVWAMARWFPTPEWEEEYPGVKRHVERPIPPTAEELDFLDPEEVELRQQEHADDWVEYRECRTSNEALETEFEEKRDKQGRTVGVISLIIAVLLTSATLLYSGRLQAITEGLLLGGIFILIYSIGWCCERAPDIAVLAAGIGIVVTLILGYFKFVRNPADTNQSGSD